MSFGISPGVYPREEDRSVLVPATSDSVGGIVVDSHKGRDGEPILVTSNTQFIEEFGLPTPEKVSMYSALNFLEKGKSLYVVRAVEDAEAAVASIWTSTNATDTYVSFDAALFADFTKVSAFRFRQKGKNEVTVNFAPAIDAVGMVNALNAALLAEDDAKHLVAEYTGSSVEIVDTVLGSESAVFETASFRGLLGAAAGESNTGTDTYFKFQTTGIVADYSLIDEIQIAQDGQTYVLDIERQRTDTENPIAVIDDASLLEAILAEQVRQGNLSHFTFSLDDSGIGGTGNGIVVFDLVTDGSADFVAAGCQLGSKSSGAFIDGNAGIDVSVVGHPRGLVETYNYDNVATFMVVGGIGGDATNVEADRVFGVIPADLELFPEASNGVRGGAASLEIFRVAAKSKGSWGDKISVMLNSVEGESDEYQLDVYFDGLPVESFGVASVDKLDGYGKSMLAEDVINGVSAYVSVESFGVTGNVEGQHEDLKGGKDNTNVPSEGTVIAAYQQFSNRDLIDVNLLINAGWATPAVQSAMDVIAQQRRDCVALLDTPYSANNPQKMVAYRKNADGEGMTINSSWSALYGGWVKYYDQYNDKVLYLPPSGFVGAVAAYSSEVAEVWFAPAGFNRGLISALGTQYTFSEGERDLLYAAGVNPIQNFVGRGVVVWGQKTLQVKPSALDRVNVRMLMITIQKAISIALEAFVFEFNDDFTRANISSMVNNYMEDVQARRGVTDFKVVCDNTNNTGQVIDQNKLICDVYVKPSRAAEFIRLNAIITPTGTSFS